MANEYMKKSSITLTIKEMQIKVALRLHLTPGRMVSIKSTNNNKCCPKLEETTLWNLGDEGKEKKVIEHQ
jgi:hypothetical protein